MSGKLLALILMATSGGLGYLVLTSPLFTVHRIEARGNKALTGEEVTIFAAADGQSMWFVKPTEIAQRISESPYVESVNVRLQLPDTVVVNVRERQPNVRWIHDGHTFAVTNAGLIVDELNEPPVLPVASALVSGTTALTPTDLLSGTQTISGTTDAGATFASDITIVDTTPNRPLKVRDWVDPDALELARRVALRNYELPPITRIEWDAGMGVSLIIGDNRQVVLGGSADLDRKLATLRFLVKDGTPFKFLDLRPDTPYYR